MSPASKDTYDPFSRHNQAKKQRFLNMRENESFSIVKKESSRLVDLKKRLETLKKESYPRQMVIDRNESKYLEIIQCASPLNSNSSKVGLNSFLSQRRSPFLDKTQATAVSIQQMIKDKND